MYMYFTRHDVMLGRLASSCGVQEPLYDRVTSIKQGPLLHDDDDDDAHPRRRFSSLDANNFFPLFFLQFFK